MRLTAKMSQSIVFCLVVLFIVPISFSQASTEASTEIQSLYNDICNNDKSAQLTTTLQVKALAKLIKEQFSGSSNTDGSPCPQRIREILTKLGDLVATAEESVCSQVKANLIRDFYLDEIVGPESKPPYAIEHFFAAYGLRVSQACRQEMIQFFDRMQNEIMTLLSPDDKLLMIYWTGKASPLVNMLKDPKNFKDLIVPKALVKGPPKIRIDRSVLRLEIATQIRQQQVRCLRRFKPIYEPLMMPLVTLSSIGFNYDATKDKKLSDPRSEQSDMFIYNWYRILYMCESLTSFAIVDDDSIPYDYEATKRNNKSIRVIVGPKEEFEIKWAGTKKKYDGEEIHQELLDSIAANAGPSIESPDVVIPPISSHMYDDLKLSAQIQDPIVSLNDKTLMLAMEKFEKKAKNECSLPSKLTKKLQSGLKSLVSGNEIKDVVQLIDLIQEREVLISDVNGCQRENLDKYLKRKHRREYAIKIAVGVGGTLAISLIAVGVGVLIKSGVDIVHHAEQAADGIREIGQALSDSSSSMSDMINQANGAGLATLG